MHAIKDRERMKEKVINYIYMLRKIGAIAPAYIPLSIIMQVCSKISTYISIYYIQFLLNTLSESVSAFSSIAFILIIYLYNWAYGLLASFVSNSVFPKYKNKLRLELQKELYNKSIKISLERMSSPEYYDKYTFALQQADSRAIETVNNFASIFGTIIHIAIFTSLIASLNSLLVFVILLSVSVSMIINSLIMTEQLRYSEAVIPDTRVIGYVNRILYAPDFNKEFKMYDIYSIFESRFEAAMNSITHLTTERGCRVNRLQAISTTFSTIVNGGITIWASVCVIAGSFLIGDFTAVISGTQQLSQGIVGFANAIKSAYENSLYIQKYRDFLDLEEQDGHIGLQSTAIKEFNLDLREVSFSYSGSARPSVLNVSLTIRQGEFIAFVGPNGAGKSTLAKIIARLYSPSSGVMLINGVSCTDYSSSEYRSNVGFLFQDSRFFAASIAENILMRKIDDSDTDEKVVLEALKKVGLYEKITGMPSGIYTQMSNEFDDSGIMLSGGELQRLVLARILVRECRLIIYDEPSNSLDGQSDDSILQLISSLRQRPTIIMISHNLSYVMLADKIFYIDRGVIKTSGTFDEMSHNSQDFQNLFLHKQNTKEES